MIISVPFWLALWQAEAIMLALGQDAALARRLRAAASWCDAACMLRRWPSSCCVPSRSRSSGRAPPLYVSLAAIAFNAFADWVLMFGKLGFPALGIVGPASPRPCLKHLFMLAGWS